MSHFKHLNLNPALEAALAELRISRPSAIQNLAIPRLLSSDAYQPPSKMNGRLSLVAAPTGTGKTLSYLLPLFQQVKALETASMTAYQQHQQQFGLTNPHFGGEPYRSKAPRAIIVTPTRELADQTLAVVKALAHHCRLRSVALINQRNEDAQRRYLEQTGADVIVGTPGRIARFREEGFIPMRALSYLVVDEAEMMCDRTFLSEWEEALLTPTLSLFSRRQAAANKQLQQQQQQQAQNAEPEAAVQDTRHSVYRTSNLPAEIVMVSATVMQNVSSTAQQIASQNSLVYEQIVDEKTHFLPSGISHDFVRVGARDKIDLLASDVLPAKEGRVIIFCNSMDSARAVEYGLREKFPEADRARAIVSLHSGIPPERRWAAYDACRSPAARWIVATDVFARGLDTNYVDHVVHFDFPRSREDFVNRVGRVGRLSSPRRKGTSNTVLYTQQDAAEAKDLEELIKENKPILKVA
jgi:ATP-dependent RNA helicase DDX24/MAK5